MIIYKSLIVNRRERLLHYYVISSSTNLLILMNNDLSKVLKLDRTIEIDKSYPFCSNQ